MAVLPLSRSAQLGMTLPAKKSKERLRLPFEQTKRTARWVQARNRF